MKLQIDMDGEPYSLQLRREGIDFQYTLSGAAKQSGTASVVEVSPGIYSVLLGSKSFTVFISANADEFEVVSSGQRHVTTVFDPRDRKSMGESSGQTGPVQIKALMPGKIVQLLVGVGAQVKAGQGLIVVEAMKMQNEMKSPKSGVVSKIHAETGATVAAGAMLLIIE